VIRKNLFILFLLSSNLLLSNEYYMYEEDNNDGMVFAWMWFVVASWLFISNLLDYKEENKNTTIVMGIIAIILGYMLLN